MSTTNPPQQDSPTTPHPLGDPRKGPEAYLDLAERQNLTRMLSYPEDLPPKFKAWLIDFIAVNASGIPASAITGQARSSISTRLTRGADQGGLSGGVRANIVWTVAVWDPGSMWDGVSKIVVPRPGKYLATLNVEFAVAPGQVEIWKNNATREVVGASPVGNVVTVLDLAAGDFVEAKIVPAGSTTIVHAEANHTPVFTLTRVSV